MFRPLAWTKTMALVFSSLLSITLVPVLMPMFIRGPLASGIAKPRGSRTHAIYLPVLALVLRHWKLVVAINLIFLAVTIPLYFKLGSQFMPSLYEGSSLYMPTALPGISIHAGDAADAGAGPHYPLLSGGRKRVRHGGPFRQRHRQCAARYVRHDHHVEAPAKNGARA